MTPLGLIARIVVVIAFLIGLTWFVVVGDRGWRRHRVLSRRRLRTVGPSLGLLGGVLVVNTVARRVGPDLSWLIGLNATGVIFAFEGAFVAWVQSFASPRLTLYFSAVYVYGYIYLLVFPLVAYAVLEDLEPLRETAIAYSLNYAIGVVCYVLIVAYGPRNLLPELVDPLLFSSWPQAQLLVSEVNRNTNVFPSLHASLSVTVALLAYRTRDQYPRWLPIATLLAASVVVSTMYLGIHWGTDVVAGGLLAGFSVWIATRGPGMPGTWPSPRST